MERVMVGYSSTGQGASSPRAPAVVVGVPGGPALPGELYTNPGCGLSPHGLAAHDSGIDLSPHDLDSQGIPTQEIEYHDVSSSDSLSEASSLCPSIEIGLKYHLGGGCGVGALPDQGRKGERPNSASKGRRRKSPPKTNFDINDNSLVSVYDFFKTVLGASAASAVAIDNKIEQAMDLVKSHLMFAVREEVEVLKERIVELTDKIHNLESENKLLRQYAPQDTIQQVQQQLPPPTQHSSTSS